MDLNVVILGNGERTALLIHGMCGSHESWAAVSDLLVARGYRVLALDLPGHGLSPRDPDSTVASAADAVVASVSERAPGLLSAAIGHSYGGAVLAAAAVRLRPTTTVYVDAGMSIIGGQDRAALNAQYERDRGNRRQREWLRRNRLYDDDRAVAAEARAAENFDPATMAAVSVGDDVQWMPSPGSIVVRADPSAWVTDADAERLTWNGIEVRSIRGAEHTIWYSHFDEFVGALPEVFEQPGVSGR